MAETITLEHVGIPATPETFDATVALYTEVFGWRVIEERPAATLNDRVFFLSDGHGGAFEIWVGSSGPPIADPAHIAFAVPFDQFDALADRVAAAGITLDEPFINDVGDKISFFNDPAGNRAQVIGRLKQLPSRFA